MPLTEAVLVPADQRHRLRRVSGISERADVVVIRDREEVEPPQLGDGDLFARRPSERVRLVGSGVVVVGPSPHVVREDGVAVQVAHQPLALPRPRGGVTDARKQRDAGAGERGVPEEIPPRYRPFHVVEVRRGGADVLRSALERG